MSEESNCICDERRKNALAENFHYDKAYYWTCPAHGFSGIDFRSIPRPIIPSQNPYPRRPGFTPARG